jgi:hypothetical protein
MFVAGLFTIAKYGNSQNASLLMNGLRNSIIHNGILFSHKEE